MMNLRSQRGVQPEPAAVAANVAPPQTASAPAALNAGQGQPQVRPPREEVIELSRPIMTHDGEKSRITMREPNGEQILTHGMPFTIKIERDENGGVKSYEMVPVPEAVRALIPKCTGLDMGMIAQCGAIDIIAMQSALVNLCAPASGN